MITRAHLGLGGNLGDPAASMALALRTLGSRSDTHIIDVSRLFRTPPWGLLDQPSFLNACAAIDTELGPSELLGACLALERAMGRERLQRWGPRTIDIDVLDWGGRAIEAEGLTLPHPRIAERAFVLVPLSELAPTLAVKGRALTFWLKGIDAGGIEPVSADGSWWNAGRAP